MADRIIVSCPFCGWDEYPVMVINDTLDGNHEARAHCAECDASGPLIQIGAAATDAQREELTLASWNERKPTHITSWRK